MKDPEEDNTLDEFEANFDDFMDEEVVTDSEKAPNLECKKMWCREFLLGFIRLHQFIHALINTENEFKHREKLVFYLQGFESLSDLQEIEFIDTDKTKTLTQENMKKQDLLKFTEKMLLFTWASTLPAFGDTSGYDKAMADELILIAKNNSNLMREWLKSVAVIVDSRRNLKQIIDRLKFMDDKTTDYYKSTRDTMIAIRNNNEEKEHEYKTQNAFILYVQYFNFRKKKILYGEAIDRLPRITHDDNTLYDDSDVSPESSSDDDL